MRSSGHQSIATHKVFDSIVVAYLDPKSYFRCIILNKHTYEALRKSHVYKKNIEILLKQSSLKTLRHDVFNDLHGDSQGNTVKDALIRISEQKGDIHDFNVAATQFDRLPLSAITAGRSCRNVIGGVLCITGGTFITKYFNEMGWKPYSFQTMSVCYLPIAVGIVLVASTVRSGVRDWLANRAQTHLRRGIGLFTRLLEQPAALDQEPDLEAGGQSYGSTMQKGPSS